MFNCLAILYVPTGSPLTDMSPSVSYTSRMVEMASVSLLSARAQWRMRSMYARSLVNSRSRSMSLASLHVSGS